MGKNFLKKLLSLSTQKMKSEKKFIIDVPKESLDWKIDDTLGNTLQYKINGEWFYDTKTSLPNGELEIITVFEELLSKKIEIRYYR